MFYGWDASDFDWDRGARQSNVAAAAKEGIRLFTHKITEGTKTVHIRAGAMVKAAVDAGIPFVGFYVVTRTPGNNGHGSVSAQVDFAIREANKQFPAWKSTPGFFWQVDLEHWSYDKVAPKHGNEMCRLFEERTGKKTVLYAPRWAYGDSIPGKTPLWASNYANPQTPADFKTMWSRAPKPHPGFAAYSGRKPIVLQYTDRARIGGQHTCDANVIDMTEAEFAAFVGGSASSSGWDATIQKINKDSGTSPQMKARSFLAYAHEYALERLRRLNTALENQAKLIKAVDDLQAKLDREDEC